MITAYVPIRSIRIGLVAVAASLVAAAASAQTITVTTREDVTDFSALQQVQNLPGPDGFVSFREACIACNNTAGPQTVAFAIPAASPGWSSGVILLWMGDGAFVLNDDETTIDFSTQTAFTGDTNPNGYEVGIQASVTLAGIPAIIVNANRCLVRGLDRIVWAGHGVELSGNDNRVVGCSIYNALYSAVNVEGYFGGPIATGNIIGGTLPGEGSVLGGVSILGASSNTVVIGNTISGGGVRIEGATQFDHPCSNVRIGGPTIAERNVIFGGGGFGEEGFPTGQKISIIDADGVVVEGNVIGTNADGTAVASPLAPTGILVRSARNVTLRDNLISGIAVTGRNHYAGQRFGVAISVTGTSVDTQIHGNRIGTDATGTLPIPNLHGVVVQPFTASEIPTGTIIGGTTAGRANAIAFSESTGVRIHGSVTGVPVRGNSIHSNGGLGIDLLSSAGGSGLTPNDMGDDDAGGNNLQNYPVLSAAQSTATTTHVQGMLGSRPNQPYTIDFYASAQCDPSGFGEGQTYLGTAQVTTNDSGNASFDAIVATGSAVGAAITATATDSAGNTAEFGPCVTSTPGSQRTPGDVNGDGHVDLSDLALLLSSFGLCSGDAGFNAAADIDGNGCVELGDLAILLAHFGM